MAKDLKVAVVGCGGIAMQKHLPALEQIEEVNLIGFADILPERAEKAKAKFAPNAKTYTEYKKMLTELKPDVVHVCTPNRSHCEISIAAMENGAHVMCEKPTAKTAADAKLMVAAHKKTGKLLTIGYQNRFSAMSQYLHAVCTAGELGDIYFAKAHAVRRRGIPTWGVFLNEFEQGGGPLIDIGTHALDLTLWLMNNYKPKMVVGSVYHKLGHDFNSGNPFGPWKPEEFTVEDSAFGYIVMEDGATIFLESSWALNTTDTMEAKSTLCGTKAGADMRDNKLTINASAHGRMTTTQPNLDAGGVAFYAGKSGKPGDIECRQWIDAILTGGQPCVLPEQALVVTEILEAVYDSSKSGKPVMF
jgi:predicted dehydrogenase